MPTITNRQNFKDYCLENKYTKWYFSIIEKAKNRNFDKKDSSFRTEKHHIIPKSILKNKETVLLTMREHFICHLLLTKMFVGEYKWKMQRAFWNMSHTRNIKLNSKIYECLKKDYSINCSIFMKGQNNPSYGKSKKGKYSHTNEHKIYMKNLMSGEKNPMYGKKYPEHLIFERSKNYIFYFNKKQIEIFNLRKYCRENNLDQGAMTRVNKGKQKTHKGYSKCP